MKYITENIKPLSLIALCSCAGYFLGNPMTGMVVGITIVALITLVLQIMKHTIEQIKLWGVGDWLRLFAPKPFSYIGDLWNWAFPRYHYGLLDKVSEFFKPRQRWMKKGLFTQNTPLYRLEECF